jgi:ectoine hydroxylase-related dioxygenase (phytanoyl-CoA dioxygenase family)
MADRYTEAVERVGYAVREGILDPGAVSRLRGEVENLRGEDAVRRKKGQTFAARDLLNRIPAVREMASGEAVRALIDPILGPEARIVRGLLFDKTPAANWKVPWHQDLTVAVSERREAEGYGPWSVKAGIPHVRPPVSVLEGMLSLRVHLDDTDEANGALKVLPGSHRHGRLSLTEIDEWRETRSPVVCEVSQGGAMVMRPLLLHASSAAQSPRHRRVLHLEFAAGPLPGGLEWHDVDP